MRNCVSSDGFFAGRSNAVLAELPKHLQTEDDIFMSKAWVDVEVLAKGVPDFPTLSFVLLCSFGGDAVCDGLLSRDECKFECTSGLRFHCAMT